MLIRAKRKQTSTGFTLAELVIVVAIMSALVAVTLPLGRRGNDTLQLQQHSHDIAQTLRFAIDRAERTGRALRFVFNEPDGSYYLEIETSPNQFELFRFASGRRYLGQNISLFEITGFQQTAAEHLLVFDPRRPWPAADLTLTTAEQTATIEINAGNVQYTENNL